MCQKGKAKKKYSPCSTAISSGVAILLQFTSVDTEDWKVPITLIL